MFTTAFATFVLAVVKAFPPAVELVHWISDTIREQTAQARLREKDAAVDRLIAPFRDAGLQHPSNPTGQQPTSDAKTGLSVGSNSGIGLGK